MDQKSDLESVNNVPKLENESDDNKQKNYRIQDNVSLSIRVSICLLMIIATIGSKFSTAVNLLLLSIFLLTNLTMIL